jgi:hypothetical protein
MNIAEIVLLFFISIGGSENVQVMTSPKTFSTPVACETWAKFMSPHIVNGAEDESKKRSAKGIGYMANVSHKCVVI